jgi:hypothetical protein
MKQYVSVIPNVWTPEYCQSIIDRFEKNTDQHVDTFLEGHRHFKEINISQYPDWQDVHDIILETAQRALLPYKQQQEIDDKAWPEQLGFEMFRMKKYEPNGLDEFAHHVDVGNYASARRFMAFFWYLNDVTEGGETTFEYNRNAEPWLSVKPEVGQMLMFPPLWPWGHTGKKPLSGPKYIIGGYLHYV